MLFLPVLKIAGLILLFILLFLLALLMIILFVPVIYRVDVSADSDRGRYRLELTVTWLLHFLKGRAWYRKDEEECEEDNPGFELKILWIRLFPGKDEEGDYEPEYEGSILPSGETDLYLPEETSEEAAAETDDRREAGEGSGDSGFPGVKREEEEKEEKEESAEKQGFREKVREFAGFLKRIYKNLHRIKNNAKYEIKEKYGKIKRLYYRAVYYRDTIESEEFNEAFTLALNELLRIIKALKPVKYGIDLEYGFEDPSLTGAVTGLFAAVIPLSGKKAWLEPDYERQVLKGKGFIKGRIRLFTGLIVLWRLYFNKNIRWTIRRLRK